MNLVLMADIAVAVLFALMALRAFRSGSVADCLLGAAQCAGLLVMPGPYRQFALYLLLATALAYLISQIVTGARAISYSLPVVGAAAILLAVIARPG